MKIAIMQPYFFPYIGYFQLINSVDKFILYDDVNYIKGGWINRNNILINNQSKFINAQLIGASSFKEINQIMININFNKVLKSIKQNYSKAPFFIEVYPLIEKILCNPECISVSDFNGAIIIEINKYLGIKTKIEFSSVNYNNTKGLEKAERIVEICKINSSKNYINPIGGKDLYSKEYFLQYDIKLNFLKSNYIKYKQFRIEFIPWLSIIDVMMFNSVVEINEMINDYEFE